MSIRMKQGETILWNVEDDLGDLTGVTITAGIRQGDFYKALTVTPVDLSVGTYTITGPDTSEFPAGTHLCDIKYTLSDSKDFSETFRVIFEKKVTV